MGLRSGAGRFVAVGLFAALGALVPLNLAFAQDESPIPTDEPCISGVDCPTDPPDTPTPEPTQTPCRDLLGRPCVEPTEEPTPAPTRKPTPTPEETARSTSTPSATPAPVRSVDPTPTPTPVPTRTPIPNVPSPNRGLAVLGLFGSGGMIGSAAWIWRRYLS